MYIRNLSLSLSLACLLTGYLVFVYLLKIKRNTVALFLAFGGVHATGNDSISISDDISAGRCRPQ